jgi:hypothetical protein
MSNLDFLRNPQLKKGFENIFDQSIVGRGKNIFVNTITGVAGNSGESWDEPCLTMAAAFAKLESGDTIYMSGKVREQLIAPLGVYGVTIIGADTRPRHDLAASWMAPLVAPTTNKALCEIIEQGWVFQNILFVSHTQSPAILMTRAEDAVHPDPSHAQFIGCRFFGVDGIEDVGGCFGVTVKDCQFYGLTGTAIMQNGTGIDVPTAWVIDNCQFISNANAIVKPLKWGTIKNCQFNTNTVTINLTGGTAPNYVHNNQFNIAGADFDPAGGVTGVAGDYWSNMLLDGLETGLPAN